MVYSFVSFTLIHGTKPSMCLVLADQLHFARHPGQLCKLSCRNTSQSTQNRLWQSGQAKRKTTAFCDPPRVSKLVENGRRQAMQHESSRSELNNNSELIISGIFCAKEEDVMDLISALVASLTTATSAKGWTGKRW